MSLHHSTTTSFHGAGSPEGPYIDPVTGQEIDPEFLYAIISHVLLLPPDMNYHAAPAVDAPQLGTNPPPISQNPYHAWTSWTRQGSQPPVAPATGVNSYEGFWSKFNNSQYTTQFAANEQATLLTRNSIVPLAPAGSQFPFTHTVAPSEIFSPIPRKVAPKSTFNSNHKSASSTRQKSSQPKRELTMTYTVEDLIKEFPSFARFIKVIPENIQASFVCNRFGCGAKVKGDPDAIVKHGKSHIHVTRAGTVHCIYGRCTSKVDVKDFGHHVWSHLLSNGVRCGVCNDWFATADLASNHLTRPCPVLLSESRAEGYPSHSKKVRQTKD